MGEIYENIDEYNRNKEIQNIGRITADMLNSKKFPALLTELLIRGRKLNISLVFY